MLPMKYMRLIDKPNDQIDMQLIQKPSGKSASSNRKPILLESSVLGALDKLAHDERVPAPVMLRRMVEQVLVSSTAAESFLEYIHDYWWGYKASGTRTVNMLRVDGETVSLLLYLSNTSGFAQKTDQGAELLISFYSQIAKTVPPGARAMTAVATLHQRTSTQAPTQGATDIW